MGELKGIKLLNEIEVKGLVSDFYYELPLDFNYSGESHSGWEFVYVENGRVIVNADDETYIVKKGEMICHKPFEFHTIKPYESGAKVMIFCFYSDNEYMEYFNNKIIAINQRQKQYLNDIVNMGKAIFLSKAPLDIARDGGMDVSPDSSPLNEQFVKNSIELLIISLLSANTTEKQSRVSLYEHVTERETLTQNIIKYLNENTDKQLSLKEISKQFSYSLSSIKRIFKEETGSSIITYFNNIRMERAKEMLLRSKMSIEGIAASLGFSNSYYFSTSFKKNFGESPSKFRTENKAK
ncbi:MAG: helix-turn-helix domain-containing protein [Clostridia bacterium]|nr:helix-turn-helix domain-containing protein [Clostridia bacterium]